MADQEDPELSNLRDEVIRKLRETLNQHRQITEQEDEAPPDLPEKTTIDPKSTAPKTGHRHEPKKRSGGNTTQAGYRRHRLTPELKKALDAAERGEQLSYRAQHSALQDEFKSAAIHVGRDSPIVMQVGALDPEQHRKQLNNSDFEAEIALKKSYGKWFLIILAVQLGIMNGVFISVGFEWLKFDPLTLQLYMGGTLTEVFGLVLVVTKYLFKKR